MHQLVLSEIQGILCHFLPKPLLVCFDFYAFMWFNSDAFPSKRWVLHNYGVIAGFFWGVWSSIQINPNDKNKTDEGKKVLFECKTGEANLI